MLDAYSWTACFQAPIQHGNPTVPPLPHKGDPPLVRKQEEDKDIHTPGCGPTVGQGYTRSKKYFK